MKRLKIILIGSLIFLIANTVNAQLIVRVKTPAPKVVVVKPAKPGLNYIWVEGHWKKVRGGKQWIPGYWKKTKRIRIRG